MVYKYTNSSWSQVGSTIVREETGDRFGDAVSINRDGTIIAVGAPKDFERDHPGEVEVYKLTNGSWVQMGSDIVGEANGDYFCIDVRLTASGTTIVIGGFKNGAGGDDAGHARIYDWNDSAWAQRGIDIDGESAEDRGGSKVSISDNGNTMAIASPNDDGAASNAGAVRIFDWD